MFFNKFTIISFLENSKYILNIYINKLITITNFINEVSKQFNFNLFLNFFFWKASNYASSNWFLYDQKLQSLNTLLFK